MKKSISESCVSSTSYFKQFTFHYILIELVAKVTTENDEMYSLWPLSLQMTSLSWQAAISYCSVRCLLHNATIEIIRFHCVRAGYEISLCYHCRYYVTSIVNNEMDFKLYLL